MALIKCIECGREVSSRADACPQCGCPVGAQPASQVIETQTVSTTGTTLASAPAVEVYAEVAKVLQKPFDEMLSFLEAKIESGDLESPYLVTDFLRAAEQFSDRCCNSCAELLRRSSRVPEVKASPTVTLAKQIRTEVFSKCDTILAECQQHVVARSALIATGSSSGEPGVLSTALQGAATGQLAAGLGKHGKMLGALGAVIAVGEQWSRQTALLRTTLDGAEQAQAAARSKIPEYLSAMIPGLCQDLFDYSCAKCLGAEINLKLQEEAIDSLGGFVKEHQAKLDRAIQLDADRRKHRQELAAQAEAEKAAEQQRESVKKSARTKRLERTWGGWSIVSGIVIIALSVAWAAHNGPKSSDGPLFWLLIATFLLMFGVYAFMKHLIFGTRGTLALVGPTGPAIDTVQSGSKARNVSEGKVCNYCGKENPPNALSCSSCGQNDFKPAGE